AGLPLCGRDEGRRRLDALIENEVSESCLSGWHASRALCHLQDFLGILKNPERRICRLDGLDIEWVGGGRRCVQRAHCVRILASERVVNEDGQEVAVGWCLGRDDDRQGLKLRRTARLQGFEQAVDRRERLQERGRWPRSTQ